MKEYIISAEDIKALEEEFNINLSFEKDDELIRCEDCEKAYVFYADGQPIYKCGHFIGFPMGKGYCAWAIPKEAEE